MYIADCIDKKCCFDLYKIVIISDIPNLETDWIWVWLIQVSASLLAYMAARIACKTHLQIVGFSLPLLLAPLVTFGLMVAGCEVWNRDPFVFSNIIPTYLYWYCYPKGIAFIY